MLIASYSPIRIGGALLAGIAAIGWIEERLTGESNYITKGVELLPEHTPWIIGLLAIVAVVNILHQRSKITTPG